MKDNVIYSYIREQAIEDGVLVDLDHNAETRELVRNAGFCVPVCITQGVFELASVPKELEGSQDFKGRLWDVLFMSVMAFKNTPEADRRLVTFKVIFQQTPQKSEMITLWLVFNECEGFTIMKPEEY